MNPVCSYATGAADIWSGTGRMSLFAYDAADRFTRADTPHAGQQRWKFDPAGIYYNRYRYYDMRLGNYVAQDPIGLNCDINKFQYPINPISYFDSMGLEGCLVNFTDCPIEYATGKTSTWLGGHSGILAYD